MTVSGVFMYNKYYNQSFKLSALLTITLEGLVFVHSMIYQAIYTTI